MKQLLINLVWGVIKSYIAIALIFYAISLIVTWFAIPIIITKMQAFGILIIVDLILTAFRSTSDIELKLANSHAFNNFQNILKALTTLLKINNKTLNIDTTLKSNTNAEFKKYLEISELGVKELDTLARNLIIPYLFIQIIMKTFFAFIIFRIFF